eukprot:scaffold4637_cov128-Cylindrotheca_fusiformis.AAC.7
MPRSLNRHGEINCITQRSYSPTRHLNLKQTCVCIPALTKFRAWLCVCWLTGHQIGVRANNKPLASIVAEDNCLNVPLLSNVIKARTQQLMATSVHSAIMVEWMCHKTNRIPKIGHEHKLANGPSDWTSKLVCRLTGSTRFLRPKRLP